MNPRVTFITEVTDTNESTLAVRFIGTPQEVEALSARLQATVIGVPLQPLVFGGNVDARGEQKFQAGDWVRIADDLGPGMRHFESGCEAIVEGSYHDYRGHGNVNDYTLRLMDGSVSAWYHGEQLTLIEPARFDKLFALRALRNQPE